MKKLLLVCLCFAMLGCSVIGIKPTPTNETLALSAGQIFGYKFAQQNPTLIDSAMATATSLTAGSATQDAVAAVKILAMKYGADPLLTLEITNILNLIQLTDPTTGQEFDMTLVKAAATGVIQGLQLYQSTVATQGVKAARIFH
jgi:hypothetical protein